MLDLGDGRFVVLPRLLETDPGVAHLFAETVAFVGRHQQLTIEACLVFSELGGRRGQRGIVPLLRIAQGGLAIGKLRCELRFASRQALDVGIGGFVGHGTRRRGRR